MRIVPSLTAYRKSEKPRSRNHPDPGPRFAITGRTDCPGDEMLDDLVKKGVTEEALMLEIEPSLIDGNG